MQVRMAHRKDIKILKELRLSYIGEDMGLPPEPLRGGMEQAMEVYFKKHIGKDFFAFIAQDKEEILGTAFLCVQERPANPYFLNGRTGMVLNVLVKKEHRKKGVGTRLMEELLKKAKELSLTYVELLATVDGRRLYEKLGFSVYKPQNTQMRYTL